MSEDARFRLKLSDLYVSKEEMLQHLTHRLTFAELNASGFVIALCVTCAEREGLKVDSAVYGKIIGVMTEPGPIALLKTLVDPWIIDEADFFANLDNDPKNVN
jgi:hypothetical protein